MMKIRVVPETNSSSNHSLIIFPADFTAQYIKPEEIPNYTHKYLEEILPAAARKFEETAMKKGWEINDEYYPIDWETETDVEVITPGVDRDEAVAKLYAEVVETALKLNLFVEMEFDDGIKSPIFPWLGAAFHGGIIRIYKPGNYYIAYMISHNDNNTIFARFKYTDENDFTPRIPESIDLKITNKCYAMCPFCHENSTPDGEHADEETLKKLYKALKKTPVPEIAVGGGNPLLHPDIDKIIRTISRTSVVGITARDVDYIEYGVPENAHGYGISLTSPKKLAHLLNEGEVFMGYPVIHVINGVHRTEEVSKAITAYELTADGDTIPAVLILGFKHYGRGRNWKTRNTIDVDALMKKHPNVVFSFDDLAIEQLGMKEKVPKERWDVLYNGRDAEYTMYIDLVKKQYAKNSYSDERYPIKEWDIEKIFAHVRGT